MTTSSTWTDEGIWAATIGAYETRESALAEAERQSSTPQDYAMNCIAAAIEQGADFERSDAFASLCRQLGVAVS